MGVHAAAATSFGRMHRSHKESLAAVTLAEAFNKLLDAYAASLLVPYSTLATKAAAKAKACARAAAEQLQTLASIALIDRARVKQL